MMNDSWDSAEEEILKLCYSAGNVKAIAQLLGRSLDSVRAKAKRMGLHARQSHCVKFGLKQLWRALATSESDHCRQTSCVCYKTCLDHAADNFWESFSCRECKRFVTT